MGGNIAETINIFQNEQKKQLSCYKKLNDDICVSVFEGFSLKDYIYTRMMFCKLKHTQPCENCSRLLDVAKVVLEKGFLQLKTAFEIACPNVTYTSKNAKRKLLQMPLASVAVGKLSKGTYRVFLVEKQDNVQYTIMQSLLHQWWELQSTEPSSSLTRSTVTSLLELAESDAERKRLKYAIVSATGLSNTKASKWYGFQNMTSVVSEVEEALKEAAAIRQVISKLAELKDKELLKSLGISDEESSEPESGDESETDSDSDSVDKNSVEEDCGETNVDNGELHLGTNDDSMNSKHLIDVLRKCDFNWLEFVSKVEKEKSSIDKNILDRSLEEFLEELPSLGITEHNYNLIQQSRQVYHNRNLLLEKQDEINDGMIVSDEEFDNPEDFLQVRKPLDDAGKNLIFKKRAAIRRKAKRDIKKKIAERRFLMRRRSKRVGKILRECPDVGKTIEEFVEKCGVGADAWRRTGIYTFDGNRRLEKKVTFKRIQEHLQSTYKRSFSYGTVMQLCVARNKRRKSAMRYKGLARVVQRRARKGFAVKYNPDVHWSAALY